MSWKETAEPVLSRMPSVERPTGHQEFREKLMWTGLVLLLYFFLTNVPLFGVGTASGDAFGRLRSILAGAQGSFLQLGIGPIVTGSIVLQLLSGADLLGLDQQDPRDQVLYQGLQKLLVILMSALTGLAMVFGGNFLPANALVGQQLGIPLTGVEAIIFAQVFVGGIVILFMDEIVSKWGVGSGVGLFIIAGISQKLIGGLFYWGGENGSPGIVFRWYDIATGKITVGSPFTADGLSTLLTGPPALLPLFTTLLIFGIVVYAESVRIEIPLSHAQVKGARGRFPVKLIYASVLPMILVRALQANIQFLGKILNAQLGADMPSWVGVYSNGQPVSGLFYYLAPIYRPEDWMWWSAAASQEVWQILVRIGIDLTFMIAGGALFAVFWVETTDMGPRSVAKQIHSSGMQIPGFRRNTGIMEKVMERYIPQVTILGGAIVGILAVMANMLGTIGQVGGTGLLLTVSITYKIYEEIAEEQLKSMYPGMKDLF